MYVFKRKSVISEVQFDMFSFSYTHRRVLFFIDNQRDLLDFHPNKTEQY